MYVFEQDLQAQKDLLVCLGILSPFAKGEVRRTGGFYVENTHRNYIISVFIYLYIFSLMVIPYNSKNKEYARINRHQYFMTEAE